MPATTSRSVVREPTSFATAPVKFSPKPIFDVSEFLTPLEVNIKRNTGTKNVRNSRYLTEETGTIDREKEKD